MKKIITATLAIALFAAPVFAQKSNDALVAAINKAKATCENPKKAENVNTWLTLAKKCMDAYSAPTATVIPGSNRDELALLMGSEKPVSTEEVVIAGNTYLKDIYANKELYFDANNSLRFIVVTKPVAENLLEDAAAAYRTAYAKDVKAAKTKDIVAGLQTIASHYTEDAYNTYTFGDYSASSVAFAKAAEAVAGDPVNIIDTASIYNAGFTAYYAGEYERAEKYIKDAIAVEYYGEDGAAFSTLADIYAKRGDDAASRAILEEGFVKFPQSQAVLIGLINNYLNKGDNPDKLFELIGEAKKNEPENVSLYYVEGNINKELGRFEQAVKCYGDCAVVNPDYEFGYIGLGVIWYEKAVEISDKAQVEFNDAKYNALIAERNQALMNALEPFEKSYALTGDTSVKVGVADYLKNIYFLFRNDKPEYMAAYEKYNEIVKSGVAQ